MKRIIIIFILMASMFMVTIPVQAVPTYIDIMSEFCHTDGSDIDWQISTSSYISDNMFSWNKNGTESVSATRPYQGGVVSHASVNVAGTTTFLEAWTDHYESGTTYAEMLFRPVGASYITLDNIDTYSSGFVHPQLTLTDITTGETLFDLMVYCGAFELDQAFPGLFPNGLYFGSWNPETAMQDYWRQLELEYSDGPYNYPLSSGFIPVDSSHTYHLKASSYVMESDRGWISANMNIRVPETTTILLLGLGLMGLTGLRRKIKK